MGRAESTDGRAPGQTAHERFKSRSWLRFWVGLGVAGILHILIFIMAPGIEPAEFRAEGRRPGMEALALVPPHLIRERELRPPPRPEPPLAGRETNPVPTRRPTPVLEAPAEIVIVDPAEELEEFTSLSGGGVDESDPLYIPPLPEPPGSRAKRDPALSGYRHVHGLMRKPELTNRWQVSRALLREYPRELQQAQVEGSVLIWFWVDEKGKVRHYEIRRSSGNPELDLAAERVIPKMKFRPARDRGDAVPVIVALPITFEVTESF